jgi:hypothetical protein
MEGVVAVVGSDLLKWLKNGSIETTEEGRTVIQHRLLGSKSLKEGAMWRAA